MIKDERNYHLRLQEFCDCFMETDPKKELEKASKGASGDPGGDPDEHALKFLGLSVFYGISEKAKRVSIQRTRDGKVAFSAEGKGRHPLLPPNATLADRIVSIARSITHVETDQGRLPVSLGLRNDRIEVTFQFDRQGGDETFSILFPDL